MKLTLLTLLAILFICSSAVSQKINYEKTYEKAVLKSKAENKPLFLFIDITPPPRVSNYMEGFNTPEVTSLFNEHFINFRTNREDQTVSSPLMKKYSLNKFPSFVFVDNEGGLIFKDFGNSITSVKYVDMARRAIHESKGKSLIHYDNEFTFGNRDSAFIRDYILKRRNAGITNNSSLVEEYVQQLSISDLSDYSKVLFILEAGPTADSKAYKLAYTNKSIIDSIYKTEPLSKRTALNNTIIDNSMAEAIKLKSFPKLQRVANFVRSTWGQDFQQAQKNSTLKYLQYYQAINDTSKYLITASNYYEQNYMHISADSIKRNDAKQLENARSAVVNVVPAKPGTVGVRSFSVVLSKNAFSAELNNGAFSIYQTGTKNAKYLSTAMLWSKRSIELDPKAAYYDTLAHLLYRLGFYSEATATQEKAIELAKAEKRNYKNLQDELKKMESKTL